MEYSVITNNAKFCTIHRHFASTVLTVTQINTASMYSDNQVYN